MGTKLQEELNQLQVGDVEQEVLISLLDILDDELIARFGLPQIAAHMVSWYTVALEYFNFEDEEELLTIYSTHFKLLQKLSQVETRSVKGNKALNSLFSHLFQSFPDKIDDYQKERDFGRFIFFHVMRYSLNEGLSLDLNSLIRKFSVRFLRKQEITVFTKNISNADINEKVFPELIKELILFVENYVYVEAATFSDISLFTHIYNHKDKDVAGSEHQTVKQSDSILPIPVIQPNNKLPHPNKMVLKKVRLPCQPKETDFQAFQRHDDQALNLPWLSYSLSNEQSRAIVSELKSELLSSSEALLYLLMIQTSKSTEQILSLSISWNLSVTSSGIYPELKLIAFEHLELKNQYQPTAPNPLVYHHDELICLPLDNSIADALLELDPQKQAKYLFELVEHSELDHTFRNRTKQRAGIVRRMLSDKALQYMMFNEISQLSDPVVASLLLATDKFSNPITLYYRSISSKEGEQLYQTAMNNLGFSVVTFSSPFFGYIGSQLTIDKAKFVTVITNKVVRIKAGLKEVNNIEQFNDFALYTALMLMFNGLTRRAKHLFFSSNTISITHRLLLVCDKYTEAYSAVRMLPLTDSAISQLEAYKKALKYFANKLSKQDRHHSDLLYSHYKTNKDSSIAFVCMLKNKRLAPISTKDIVDWLGLDIPENFVRHLMVSSLPKSLGPYTQIFLGHYNQKQHPNDPFRLNRHSFPDNCTLALESTFNKLGVVPISIPSTRGDIKKDTDLSDFPPNYYPQSWLDREYKNVATIRKLKRLLPTLVFSSNDYDYINETFETLMVSINDNPNIDSSLANKYLKNWKQYFNQTQSFRLRHSYVNQNGHINTSLRLLEYEQVLYEIRELYLDYISERKSLEKNRGITLVIGICLFQPDFAKRLFKDKPRKLTLFLMNKTLFSSYYDDRDVEQSYPINFLVTGVLLKYGLSIKEIRFNWNSKKDTYSSFFDFMTEKWTSLYTLRSLSTFNKFVTFCIRNSILNHSAITRTDGNNFSLSSTHYPIIELKRLLHPYNQFQRAIPVITSDTINHSMSNYQRSNRRAWSQDQEKKLYSSLHRFFDNNSLKSDELAAAFRLHWAHLLNSSSVELSDLLDESAQLSQYMFALIWYMHDYCYRISKKNKPFDASTLYGYFSTLNTALAPLCAWDDTGRQIDFLMLDDESYLLIYREALERTAKENKRDLATKLKDFHQALSDNFGIDSIDWKTNLFDINISFSSKGIAQAITYEEYQLSYHLITNFEMFSDFERLIHLALLILGYRVGLRKQEVRNLKYYDIDVSTWVIEVSASQFAPTKSTNSPRRICIDNYLNDEEKNILSSVVKTSKVNAQLHPSQLLFNCNSEHTFLNMVKIFKNVVDIVKLVTGNDKIRYYDLRHNFINYNLLILSDAKFDERYQKVLGQWARKSDLSTFSQKITDNLLAAVPNHGASLTLALSKFMGHSIHTQREYYQHCLHVIGEVEANKLVHQHLSRKQRKELHLVDSTKLVRHYCVQVQKKLAELTPTPTKYDYKHENLTLVYSLDTLKYQDIQYRCTVLNNLIFYIQDMNKCAGQYRVSVDSLNSMLQRLEFFVIETQHLAIPTNWFRSLKLNSRLELIKQYSRYFYSPTFKKLLTDLILLRVNNNCLLEKFIKLWLHRAVEHQFIVSDDEFTVVSEFAAYMQLNVNESSDVLCKKMNLLGKNIKFSHNHAHKKCMQKLSLAIAFIFIVNSD